MLALRRIIQIGQAGVIELQVGAAELAQAFNLIRVDLLQVPPELFHVRIDRLVDRRATAAVMSHVRRGNGEFGGACCGRFEELKIFAEDTFLELELSAHANGRRRKFDVALLVVEFHLHIVVGFGHSADLVEKVHVPGSTPMLAVGDALQPDVLLHFDHFADGLILEVAQFGGRDAAGLMLFTRLQEFFRAQQASHVVGAKRRFVSAAHLASSHFGLASLEGRGPVSRQFQQDALLR